MPPAVLGDDTGRPEDAIDRETKKAAAVKVALVTGATRGLGAAIAVALARDGWRVAVNHADDDAGATRVVDRIVAGGGSACAARFSVVEEERLGPGLDAIRSTLGPVDLIVNNATGPQPVMPLLEQSWRSYLDQLEFFVKAPLELLRLVLPDWRARKSGRVVNIGSEIAETGTPNLGNYACAKGAMLSMTRSWANELAPEGITVNLVAPGWIPVERHAGIARDRRERYLDRTPLGRFGVPEDVAEAVAFLASEKARFITGQRLSVNGGHTLL